MSKFNPKTIAWWHESLADWMLINPDRPMKDAAPVFGVTENYIYLLKNSDSFQAYWKHRRATQAEKVGDIHLEGVGGSIVEKVKTVADMALDQIIDQLEKNSMAQRAGAPVIATDELRATADMALKKLGYGLPSAGNTSPVHATQINVSIDAGALAAAREKMQKLYGVLPSGSAGAQEVECIEVSEVLPPGGMPGS